MQLSKCFEDFINEVKGNSPLYEALSIRIQNDEYILTLCENVRLGQPVPNMLFASVQYLLLSGAQHNLREFYPSVVSDAKEPNDAFPAFLDFCKTYENGIVELLKSRLVQTNEVRRCTYLYPVFCDIFAKVRCPLALVEIGPSLGLNLIWDQYAYDYGNGEVYGNKESKLLLKTEMRSELPELLLTSPPVAERIGIDLHVVELERDELWMHALIWPENVERVKLFEQAVEILRTQKIKFIQGNGSQIIEKVVETISDESVVCIFHTWVANQMPEDSKLALEKKFKEIGKTRDVFHIYNNMWDLYLHIDSYIGGELTRKTVAETNPHGKWMIWKEFY